EAGPGEPEARDEREGGFGHGATLPRAGGGGHRRHCAALFAAAEHGPAPSETPEMSGLPWQASVPSGLPWTDVSEGLIRWIRSARSKKSSPSPRTRSGP